jgi:hypothetical protein
MSASGQITIGLFQDPRQVETPRPAGDRPTGLADQENMNLTTYPQTFPRALDHELAGPWAERPFSRRLIVVRDAAKMSWMLQGCVLRPLTYGQQDRTVFKYENAILVADTVPPDDIKPFLSDLGNSLSDILGKPIHAELWVQCDKQPVSNHNYWMMSPGAVYTWRMKEAPNLPHSQLLSLDGPYYPDVEEAARDWLQVCGRGGQADVKGVVLLLLPETRAFIESSEWGDDDERLHLQLQGTALGSTQVFVKGAYWVGRRSTQVSEIVQGTNVSLHIPLEADRLDLNLLGQGGEVYEQHRESMSLLGDKRFLGSRRKETTERVIAALRKGEGQHVEFKPFIFIPKRKKGLDRDQKDKLNEVLESVAAFANAEGGTIYMGVSNRAQVIGLGPGLAEWAEAPVAPEAAQRYAGALKTHVRDSMYLPPEINVSVVEQEGELLVIIQVPRSDRPVSVNNDGRFVRRFGGRNELVHPEQWAEEWGARKSNSPFG